MEDAFLIEEANRYDIKGKFYIGTPMKYYFMDMGLRNSRIHYRQLEVTHSMENVIYNELRMRVSIRDRAICVHIIFIKKLALTS